MQASNEKEAAVFWLEFWTLELNTQFFKMIDLDFISGLSKIYFSDKILFPQEYFVKIK